MCFLQKMKKVMSDLSLLLILACLSIIISIEFNNSMTS